MTKGNQFRISRTATLRWKSRLTIIPALILTVVGVFTFRTVFDLAKTSDTEMIINVTGQQWWWEYDYPVQNEYGITQPIITSGQLVIPAGTKVLLRQTSRDVIHSYWIPALNGKRDAVPGRVHLNRIEADKPGIYAGQCTEFCGLSHANMRMEAVALSKADFAKWVANQLKPYASPAENTIGQRRRNSVYESVHSLPPSERHEACRWNSRNCSPR